MRHEDILLTPELARHFLNTMTKNRKPNQSDVNKYAKEMTNGNWSHNGQSIKFNHNGEMIDGQHRCLAVILSGVPIMITVTYGVDDPRAWKTIDNGRARNVLQLTQMMHPELKSPQIYNAIARRLAAYENTIEKGGFTLKSHSFRCVDRDEVLDLTGAMKEEIGVVVNSMKSALPVKRCKAGSAAMTALILCKRANPEKYVTFSKLLDSGIGLTEKSPVHKLRERLGFPPERSRGAQWETEVMALVIKAWNYFLEDKPMSILRWRQEGDCPEKFPTPKGA